jgi:2-dehydropantoate 2-reductase
LIGPDTAVISLQNGLGDEEEMAAIVGAERVLGGLCFVCLNRLAPGVIRHTAHGLIVLGEHLRLPQPRTGEIAERLRRAAVPCRVTENLERAHWEKLVWNIPFNGLGVAGVVGREALQTGQVPHREFRRNTLPTDELLGDPGWEGMLRELMHEVIAAAHALGYHIEPEVANEQIERTRCMGAYKASTLLDFEAGRPLEIEHLFREPLRRAQRAGVATPRLAALCAVLEALEQRD